MDHKFAGSPKSKVVSVTSLTGSTVSEPQPTKAARKPGTPTPCVRGNRTAFRRIQLAHSSPSVVHSVLDMSRCKMPPTPEQTSPLQQPKKLKELRFLCSDQQIVTVSCCLMFRYTEELRPFREEDLPIELPSIRSETLLRAISWMRQHKQEEAAGCCAAAADSHWEEELLQGNGDPCLLMELIMAAHHLGLGILARHASEFMEERMAEKTESETRLMQQISRRLAQEEHRP